MINVSISKEDEKDSLEKIYQEAYPYFLKVEGRAPLKALDDCREIIGNPPIDLKIICYTVRFNNEVAGWAWILENTDNYYILHFYISDSFKRKSVGRLAIAEFDKLYKQKGYSRSELLVSASNYVGLKFWTNLGYREILFVESPEEHGTSSVEIGLGRNF